MAFHLFESLRGGNSNEAAQGRETTSREHKKPSKPTFTLETAQLIDNVLCFKVDKTWYTLFELQRVHPSIYQAAEEDGSLSQALISSAGF